MKKLTKEDFLKKCHEIHENKYDYSDVIYTNNRTKIKIICPIHGQFFQKPNNHLLGQGCSECSNRKKLTNKTFIDKAKLIHNDVYDYSLVNYSSNKKIIIIKCKIHGEFKQTPNDHLSGKGCMDCSGKKILTIDEFINKAKIVHGDKYNYSLAIYINSKSYVEIICKYHGSFFQQPNAHLSGNNCPKCSYNCISRIENLWLDEIKVSKLYRQKSVSINGKKHRVDAYDSNTNTIYEFYGDYWHGNPKLYKSNDFNKNSKKTFGELYEKTINKENLYLSAGYKLVTIWENEFKKVMKNAT